MKTKQGTEKDMQQRGWGALRVKELSPHELSVNKA
jgi:hypothetical protein